MPAGASAAVESQRLRSLADAYRTQADLAMTQADHYDIAARSEKHTARTLAPLCGAGYRFLEDRRWPGSKRANVDLLVIGPGGVFIVDTKAWAQVSVQNGRMFRGDADVTEEIGNLAALVDVTQAELAEVGLAPGEVRAVAALAGRQDIDARVEGVRILGEKDTLRYIAGFGARLNQSQVDRVFARAMTFFLPMDAPPPYLPVVLDPVMPAADVQEPLLTVEEVNEALLEGILAEPIEDWMSFLHPQQAKLVRRSFAGPSRIRGPAGTGKTVVGLHRAAYLARTRPGKVLVTTFVRTLPQVLGHLLSRFAPDAVEQVTFTGVHAFAKAVLDERGVPYHLDKNESGRAFDHAWAHCGARNRLTSTVKGDTYWKDEIEYVIKGRGITVYDQYAELNRTGRGFALSAARRREVWELHLAYDTELRRRGVIDFADLILLAEAELAREPMDIYSAVVIDEAQDLTCAMVRLLHSLVGDTPDGLTLIGDGQQSIYPGGYALSEAGVSVAGRGVVLDVNYRNTAEIVEFASRLVARDEYADIEGKSAPGDVPSSVPRSGQQPCVAWCPDWTAIAHAMESRIQLVVNEAGTSFGDVAVLCATNDRVKIVTKHLEQANIPVVSLLRYDGTPLDAVKVGTIKRAKGLEFKHVLIPDIRRDQTGSIPPDNDADRERWVLFRRELYVAMTRARDGLWVAIEDPGREN